MGKVNLILKALILDKGAIKELSDLNSNWKLLSIIITLSLGLFYGITSINVNSDIIQSFETPFLRDVFVPGLFLFFGILMILITKIGLSLLLWAGAKGLSGHGQLKILYRNTTIALIPSTIALPAFIAIQVGASLSFMMLISICIAITWIYLICTRVLLVTQQFVPWKAYTAVAFAFIFFISIYYIVLPPTV